MATPQFFTLLLILIDSSFLVRCEINMTLYYKIPKLYELDDYDRCFVESSYPATYCLVHSEIKPNKSSEIWNIIEKFSLDKKHFFRHDRLKRGVCIGWCKEKMKKFARSSLITKYYQEKFNTTSEFILESYTFDKLIDYQIKYNKIVNICINMELKQKYGLKAYSVVEYCERKGDTPTTDSLDHTFVVICLVILALLISSSSYDCWLRKQQNKCDQHGNYYEVPIQNKAKAIFVSFSFRRNFSRLTSESLKPNAKDLRPINAFRFFTMSGVIVAHCLLFMNSVAILNPEYVENNFQRFSTMIIINGPVIIQTFFVISGFLLSVHFQNRKSEENGINFCYILKVIVLRYIRITPAYAFVILLHATYMQRLQDGPMWKHIAESERNLCRSNAWTNLLYINNYVTTSSPCFVEGWYLAADFQLFVGCSFLLYFLYRFPRSTKYVFGLAIFVSFVVPTIVSYAKNSVFIVIPENDKYAHIFDESYKNNYIPTHTNLGSYLSGIIGGIIYTNLKSIKYTFRGNYTLQSSWYMSLLLCILLLISGHYYYKDSEPLRITFWTAFYSAFLKNIWGVITTWLLLGLFFGATCEIIQNFTCHPFFRVMGRLTFSAYLLHSFFIRILIGNIRQPIYASNATVIIFSASELFVSYLASFAIALGIEFPVSALQNALLHDSDRKKEQQNHFEMTDKPVS